MVEMGRPKGSHWSWGEYLKRTGAYEQIMWQYRNIDKLSEEEIQNELSDPYIPPSQEWMYDDDKSSIEDKPEGCWACGGPWPDCESACPIFEDGP